MDSADEEDGDPGGVRVEVRRESIREVPERTIFGAALALDPELPAWTGRPEGSGMEAAYRSWRRYATIA